MGVGVGVAAGEGVGVIVGVAVGGTGVGVIVGGGMVSVGEKVGVKIGSAVWPQVVSKMIQGTTQRIFFKAASAESYQYIVLTIPQGAAAPAADSPPG